MCHGLISTGYREVRQCPNKPRFPQIYEYCALKHLISSCINGNACKETT